MNFFAEMKSYLLLLKSRFEILSYAWFVLIGCLIASRGSPQIFPSAVAAASISFIALSVYIYNDVIDADMDRLNPKKKRRPIPSGKVSKKEAMHLVFLLASLGIIMTTFLKIEIFLICLAWLIFFWAYSYPKIRLKNKIIIKEATPSVGAFASVLIGALANGLISPTVLFAGLFIFFFMLFNLPAFRDTTDIKEDKMFGVKSLATILSWKQRLEMSILSILVIMTLTPLTYVNFGFNVIFPIVVVAMSLLVLRFIFPLINRLEQTKYERTVKYIASYFYISQIAMVMASIPTLL